MKQRLGIAAALLNDPDLKVKQIARLCGFASQPYFQQVFKKAFGMTPVNYRRKQQK